MSDQNLATVTIYDGGTITGRYTIDTEDGDVGVVSGIIMNQARDGLPFRLICTDGSHALILPGSYDRIEVKAVPDAPPTELETLLRERNEALEASMHDAARISTLEDRVRWLDFLEGVMGDPKFALDYTLERIREEYEAGLG